MNLLPNSVPSLYALKAAFGRRLRPVTVVLDVSGVTPNQVTGASIGLSATMGAALALWPRQSMLLLLAAVLALRMTLNAVDGELARLTQTHSRAGLLLNDFERSFSDAVLYLPLAFVPGVPTALGVLVVVTALLRDAMHTVTVNAGLDGEWPMAKPDRALAMGTIALALGLGVPPGLWLYGALGLVVVLTAAPVVVSLRRSLRSDAP